MTLINFLETESKRIRSWKHGKSFMGLAIFLLVRVNPDISRQTCGITVWFYILTWKRIMISKKTGLPASKRGKFKLAQRWGPHKGLIQSAGNPWKSTAWALIWYQRKHWPESLRTSIFTPTPSIAAGWPLTVSQILVIDGSRRDWMRWGCKDTLQKSMICIITQPANLQEKLC